MNDELKKVRTKKYLTTIAFLAFSTSDRTEHMLLLQQVAAEVGEGVKILKLDTDKYPGISTALQVSCCYC